MLYVLEPVCVLAVTGFVSFRYWCISAFIFYLSHNVDQLYENSVLTLL